MFPGSPQQSLSSFCTKPAGFQSCVRCPQLLNTKLPSITGLSSAKGFCCSSGKHTGVRQHLTECETVCQENKEFIQVHEGVVGN